MQWKLQCFVYNTWRLQRWHFCSDINSAIFSIRNINKSVHRINQLECKIQEEKSTKQLHSLLPVWHQSPNGNALNTSETHPNAHCGFSDSPNIRVGAWDSRWTLEGRIHAFLFTHTAPAGIIQSPVFRLSLIVWKACEIISFKSTRRENQETSMTRHRLSNAHGLFHLCPTGC